MSEQAVGAFVPNPEPHAMREAQEALIGVMKQQNRTKATNEQETRAAHMGRYSKATRGEVKYFEGTLI
jgi:hypothetical protein